MCVGLDLVELVDLVYFSCISIVLVVSNFVVVVVVSLFVFIDRPMVFVGYIHGMD